MSKRSVTFDWSDEHGECYDCGAPAAYVVGDENGHTTTLCSVCTAMHVYEGEFIVRYLFEEDDQ